MRFYFFLVFTLSCIPFKSSGQTINLDSHDPLENIGRKITFFEDTSSGLSLREVEKIYERGKFKKGQNDILNLGNRRSAFWIRIVYQTSEKRNVHVIVDMPSVEHIDLYSVAGNEIKNHFRAGALERSSQKYTVTTNKFSFEIPVRNNTGDRSVIYLRVKSEKVMLLPLKIASGENYVKQYATRGKIEFIYIGALCTLFLFNLFLFLSIRDYTYFYYSAYIFSLFVYVILYIKGYSYLIGTNFRIFINTYPYIFLGISILIAGVFCQKFLNLRQSAPKMLGLYRLLYIACGFIILASLLGFRSFTSTFAQYMTITSTVILWSSGVIAYLNGHKPAKYFTIAWFFIGISIVGFILSIVGVWNASDFTFELVPAGSALELLLLSFALGDRYRILMNNEQRVRDENFYLIKNQNQRLEQLVNERTALLSDSVNRLEESNAVKNKLFSIIAHDLRSPFNSLISIFSLKEMDLLTFEELKMLLNENRKNIENIHNTLDNLLYWAKSQMEGITNNPSAFDLSSLINELVLVYRPLLIKKNIFIKLDLRPGLRVYADPDQISLVMRNLIDNAIKFTPPGAEIGLSLKDSEQTVTIIMNNSVLNPDEIDIGRIQGQNILEVTSGTQNEKGVGLGLHLCREYIKINGGNLHIQLQHEKLFFSFQLPKTLSA